MYQFFYMLKRYSDFLFYIKYENSSNSIFFPKTFDFSKTNYMLTYYCIPILFYFPFTSLLISFCSFVLLNFWFIYIL